MLRSLIIFTLLTSAVWALAQNPITASPERDEAAIAYQKRIRQEKLDNRYIPADLNDAMQTLDRSTSAASRASYAARGEDEVVERLYFSLGRWISVNWGLYDGSRFSRYLRDMGVDQPDGQQELVMRAYHRYLNQQDLDVRDLVGRYKVQRAAADSVRASRAVVIEVLPPTAIDTLRRR